MNNLRTKIASYTTLTNEELNFALQYFKPIAIPKGEYLLREGQYINFLYYLDKGCLCYFTRNDGQEQVIQFFTENDFLTDSYNYFLGKASNCNLKAMEDTLVYAITKEDTESVFGHSQALERFGRLFFQKEFIILAQRVAHLTNLSNEERYLRLLRKRPDLFQRVPQYLIASYLGLTPVGLSKMKKRISQS